MVGSTLLTWGTCWEHIVNLSNILRTQWELDRNNKNPTTPHPPHKHLLPTRKLLLNVMWSLQQPKCGAVVWFLFLPRAPLGDGAWLWSGNWFFHYWQWVFSFFGKKTLLPKAVGYIRNLTRYVLSTAVMVDIAHDCHTQPPGSKSVLCGYNVLNISLNYPLGKGML
jgi:hypothetical protein